MQYKILFSINFKQKQSQLVSLVKQEKYVCYDYFYPVNTFYFSILFLNHQIF